MPRIACLWVPEMLLAAHVRLEPELVHAALAIVDGAGSHCSIAAVSDSARDAGIVTGMKVSEARALCGALVIRRVSLDAVTTAVAAVTDVALTVSPRVEQDERHRIFVDCSGTGSLWPSESILASVLAARAEKCRLPLAVGIADSKLAAYLAARQGGDIIPIGRTREFLAPQPVSLLEFDARTAATLATWGIRTIGDLLALPSGALAHRLGAAGARVLRRARGDDDCPFASYRPRDLYAEHLDLEYAVERIESLLFTLNRLLECLCARMDLAGVGCRELELALSFEDGGCDIRPIAIVAATTDVKTLLTLVRSQLESRPPSQAIAKVAISGTAARIRPTQLDFLQPAGPAPEALAATLARLAALCGPDRVGVLRPVNSHRPEAVTVDAFRGETSGCPVKSVELVADTRPLVVRMAVRAFRPSIRLEVFESRNFLDFVRAEGRGRRFGGRVVHWAGPSRIRGEWWTTEPYVREYYDVELTDGGVYRIYRDARSGQWWADGVYD